MAAKRQFLFTDHRGFWDFGISKDHGAFWIALGWWTLAWIMVDDDPDYDCGGFGC